MQAVVCVRVTCAWAHACAVCVRAFGRPSLLADKRVRLVGGDAGNASLVLRPMPCKQWSVRNFARMYVLHTVCVCTIKCSTVCVCCCYPGTLLLMRRDVVFLGPLVMAECALEFGVQVTHK